MLCPKCKKEIENDSTFCRFCGKKLSEPPKPKPLKRANGMGNVSKLSGRRRKPWRARLSVKDDKGNSKVVVIGDYEFKREAYAALEKVINNGGINSLYGITLEEAREQWKKKHYPKLSDSGVLNYDNAWKYFEPIKKMKLSDVKTTHFQMIIDSAVEKGRSRSSCEKIKQLASQLCQWGMQNDLLNKNYATFVEIKADPPKEKESFTQEELNIIWKYYLKTKSKDAACILLLCHTGLRIDEFLSMKKECFYNGCLHGGSKTEKGRDRAIPVPDAMLPLLNEIMDSDSDYIVSNTKGGRCRQDNWRKRNYYKVLEECGFPKELRDRRNPHVCRHTYSTMCVKNKVDAKTLQDILGHEDISTTMNLYTHLDEEYLKAAARDLNFIN